MNFLKTSYEVFKGFSKNYTGQGPKAKAEPKARAQSKANAKSKGKVGRPKGSKNKSKSKK